MATKPRGQIASSAVVRIIFLALLLDLLAFTIPLPLFPRLIDGFVRSEAEAHATFAGSLERLSPSADALTPNSTLLSHTLHFVRTLRQTLFSYSSLGALTPEANARWDLTLLGGLLASLFSLCQFIISPRMGALSDKYGRRNVLLASMVGNLVSALLWVCSGSFGVYAASRLVGGLSEGNVQLSIAVISDVTSEKNRSKSLALVGVAFSLAFTLGPSLGAYFASRSLPLTSSNHLTLPGGYQLPLNAYAFPALVTLVLLTVETIYLAVKLPETRWWVKEEESEREGEKKKETEVVRVQRTKEQRGERLKELQWLHLGFLFFFSGAEFTLTFLTYTLFDYTNSQNGRLLGFIGVLSSLLQGGYVRRQKSSAPLKLAAQGVYTCVFSLSLLALLPHLGPIRSVTSPASVTLYTAGAGLAFVSATVVNSLNSLASLETDHASIDKGAALGRFRSRGQLGRAVGPLVATVVYWVWGPSACYAMGAVGSAWVAGKVRGLGRKERSAVGKGGAKKEL